MIRTMTMIVKYREEGGSTKALHPSVAAGMVETTPRWTIVITARHPHPVLGSDGGAGTRIRKPILKDIKCATLALVPPKERRLKELRDRRKR